MKVKFKRNFSYVIHKMGIKRNFLKKNNDFFFNMKLHHEKTETI